MFTPIEAPEDYQVWTDQNAHKVVLHLKDKKQPFEDELTVPWNAAPYVSLWLSKYRKERIWVLHNDMVTDSFADEDIKDPRQALAFFAIRWKRGGEELRSRLTVYNQLSEQSLTDHLESMSALMQSMVEDETLWVS